MIDLFITGATGFLGGRLLQQLDPAAFGQIHLLCRRVPELPPRLAAAANVHVIQAALDAPDDYRAALSTATRVLHLAAVTGKADPDDYDRVNVRGTASLHDAATAAGAAGFLFVSSIAAAFEDRRGYHYAESKLAAERHIQAGTLPYCILRPTMILGRGAPIWQAFYQLARKPLIVLPGTGRVQVQPIDVDDLARVLLDRLAGDGFDNEVLEVGGRDALDLDDFITRIHRACTGTRPRILHLPLALIRPPLRLVESFAPSLLPVSSGQFASFDNDGHLQANAPLVPAAGDLRGIDDIINELVEHDGT